MNSTLSFRPNTVAARSKVAKVTEGFAGSRSRSTDARLVFIRHAISVFVNLRRFIPRAIWKAITRLMAAVCVTSDKRRVCRNSSRLLPKRFFFMRSSPKQVGKTPPSRYQLVKGRFVSLLDETMQQNHRIAFDGE
jgi:hypothetical protein